MVSSCNFLSERLAEDEQALRALPSRDTRRVDAGSPNLCVIHDIGEHEGQPFIAMQYLEGETWKHRISIREMFLC